MTALVAPPIKGKPKFLPQLRQDLRLIDGGTDFAGARRWLIYDPLQHRFVAIDNTSYAMLGLWRPGRTAEQLVEEAWSRLAETFDVGEVERFATFLQASGLTLEAVGGGWRAYYASAKRRQESIASRILHTYLFFRIPLFRPERHLKATLWFVRPLGTRSFALFVMTLGLIGLYLVSREWEEFCTTFADTFTFSGAGLLAVSMILVKLLHELGHGYVAVHFGCRVPVIGVAFIVGMPMLYCDVTDAWRLKSRRQRMWVDVAGILVDLGVGCVATFAWAFLPPGPEKSLAFSLATAGWIFSLTMNLNPFMKFDGYHIAVDFSGIENLQTRAMALGRWRLRELLFGIGLPPPEKLPARTERIMLFYGWGLWIYRLITFTGIALAVYAFFFKLAGVVLFLVEIGYFIVVPVWHEIKEWMKMRKAILASRRTAVTAGVLIAVLVMAIVPWSSRVAIPAVLEVEGLARLYPPAPAMVTTVHVERGQSVSAGAVLVSLAAPTIARELELNERKTEIVRLRQSRRASDQQDRDAAVVLDQEYSSLLERKAGLLQQLADLEIRAPFSGQVVEMGQSLRAGRWINLKEPIAVVRATSRPHVRGYVDAADVWRIDEGAKARFVPDDTALASIDTRVRSIAQAGTSVLDQVELVGSYGGRVADRLDQHRQPVPVTAQYAVRAETMGELPPEFMSRTVPGLLVADGRPESFIARTWRQALKVLVRESGL